MLLARLHQIASFGPHPSQMRSSRPRPVLHSSERLVGKEAGLPAAPTSTGTIPVAPVALPPRIPLRSTNLREAAYDPTAQVLTIEFQNGRVYRYDRLPANVYRGLAYAGSHGRYFNQWIKGRYPTRRLR
jgi:hypothetical protein